MDCHDKAIETGIACQPQPFLRSCLPTTRSLIFSDKTEISEILSSQVFLATQKLLLFAERKMKRMYFVEQKTTRVQLSSFSIFSYNDISLSFLFANPPLCTCAGSHPSIPFSHLHGYNKKSTTPYTQKNFFTFFAS